MPNFVSNIFNRKQKLVEVSKVITPEVIQTAVIPEPKTEQRSADEFFNPVLGTFSLSTYNNYSNNMAMKLSTVYRAVNLISDSLAVLPLINYEIKDNWKYRLNDNITYLLNVMPNQLMSGFLFKKLMVQHIITKGNAYVEILRDDNYEPIEFRLLDPDFIRVMIDDQQVYYNSYLVYGDKTYHNIRTGKVYDDADIVHIMGYSINNLVGISVIQSAAMTLGIAYSAEEMALGMFESGGLVTGLLKPVAGAFSTPEIAAKAKSDFIAASTQTNIAGMKAPSIISLDSSYDYQPITLNSRDNQFLESRLFNIINICQFFGTPPEKLFDMSHSKNGTSEASQIDFYNSTLLGYIEKIENEFFRKIYEKVMYDSRELEFDVENLMRLDSVASATYFKTMFELGAYNTNEIREKINAKKPVKGGNEAYISTNLQKLSAPVVAAVQPVTPKPATSGNTVQTNFVDNKLKMN